MLLLVKTVHVYVTVCRHEVNTDWQRFHRLIFNKDAMSRFTFALLALLAGKAWSISQKKKRNRLNMCKSSQDLRKETIVS